jgi:hypothetical protein
VIETAASAAVSFYPDRGAIRSQLAINSGRAP